VTNYLRCPHCGVAEGEPIEEDLPVVTLEWLNDQIQNVATMRAVTHEAYFNSVENHNGDTEYVCSECRGRFKITEV
jgi:hypothetical protein